MSKLFAKHRSKLRSEKRNKKTQLSVPEPEVDHLESDSSLKQDGNQAEQQKSLTGGGIDLRITGLSHDGRGISRHKGKTQFVENALPGELVKVRVIAHKSKFDEVCAHTILEESTDRIAPKCSHYDRCGGCTLQHFRPKAQIEHKQSVLREMFSKQGLFPEEFILPISTDDFHYRSRTRIACDMRRGKGLFGFRGRASQDVLDISECLALTKPISKVSVFKEFVSRLPDSSAVGHVELFDHYGSAVVLLRLVKDLSEDTISMLALMAAERSVGLYIQAKHDSVAHKIWPKEGGALLDYSLEIDPTGMGDKTDSVNLNFHPSDFTQVNRQVNQLMVNKVIELLQLSPDQSVLDLFCGLGNFTLPIATLAADVTGVEGSADMVSRASENAVLNQLTNVEFFKANLFEAVENQRWAQKQFDSLVLDPPRAGAKELVKDISRFNAKRVVYISCNPATLARDSIAICSQGYRLKKAGILDMFPQTSHLESIALFER